MLQFCMAKKNTNAKISITILGKVVKELYFQAGMNTHKIKDLLEIPLDEVKSYLPKNASDYPVSVQENIKLVDSILYQAGKPVAREAIIATEKQRFETYATIEAKCLAVMSKLLDYYYELPCGSDLRVDEYRAKLANDFIKSTHAVRQELLQKYAIDKADVENRNRIVVEWQRKD